MKFNAKKCNIMRVSRSRKPLQHFYSLGSEILQEVSDAKYLGIQIDNKLDWNKHISTVAARGQSKLAFLNRNLKGCSKKLRDTAYISLIRPALEYSCSVWHPHKKSNKNKIEKVQRRAARFVSNNFRRKASVSEMLHNLGWQSLDSRRQDQRLVLFYKIINGLASAETEDILSTADSRNSESVWASISLKDHSKLIVGSFYRPPDKGIEPILNLETELSEITEKLRNNSKYTVMLGGYQKHRDYELW